MGSCFSCFDNDDSFKESFAIISKTNLNKNAINVGIDYLNKTTPCEYSVCEIVGLNEEDTLKSGLYYIKEKTYIKYEYLMIYIIIIIRGERQLVRFTSDQFLYIADNDTLMVNMSKGMIYDEIDGLFKDAYDISIYLRPSHGYFVLAKDIKINPTTKMFYE